MRRAALLIVIVVAGCGGGSARNEQPAQPTPNVVQPGAPGEPSRRLPASEAEAVQIDATPADLQFMQDMIHHHAQAIEMTGWVPERTASTSIRLLARRMEISQAAEIEQMERWLERHGVEPMSDHAAHGDLMPGMLTDAQLRRLEAAEGRSFDRLFLRSMTGHHQGALTMVRRLREAGGGLEPEIDAFARHVEAYQQIEIQRMQELLAKR